MKTNPIISIIVPCYNQAQYLPETLQSVLDQKYQSWECIIVNDGSPDNTEEVAKEWCEKDERFKYLSKHNEGVSEARNYGIQHALGEYVLPLDGDDKIGTNYIIDALEVFDKNPNTKLVYCNIVMFGKVNKECLLPKYVYENMFIENQIFCSAIFRKADFQQTSGYNFNMKNGLEDWDFWLTFLNKDDVVVKLDGFHFFYRIKEVSRSVSIDKEKNEALLLQIFKNHIPLFLEHFNPLRDHINAEHYMKANFTLRNSIEYKIGLFACAPFKWVKKVLNKVFK